MSTLLGDKIETGDVVEVKHAGDWLSALVLLANDEAIILDACDGSTPFVVRRDEMVDYRVFDPSLN